MKKILALLSLFLISIMASSVLVSAAWQGAVGYHYSWEDCDNTVTNIYEASKLKCNIRSSEVDSYVVVSKDGMVRSVAEQMNVYSGSKPTENMMMDDDEEYVDGSSQASMSYPMSDMGDSEVIRRVGRIVEVSRNPKSGSIYGVVTRSTSSSREIPVEEHRPNSCSPTHRDIHHVVEYDIVRERAGVNRDASFFRTYATNVRLVNC